MCLVGKISAVTGETVYLTSTSKQSFAGSHRSLFFKRCRKGGASLGVDFTADVAANVNTVRWPEILDLVLMKMEQVSSDQVVSKLRLAGQIQATDSGGR